MCHGEPLPVTGVTWNESAGSLESLGSLLSIGLLTGKHTLFISSPKALCHFDCLLYVCSFKLYWYTPILLLIK